jgi:S1-C subfamily serine protease
VGNAGGTGSLVSAKGTVTGLNKSITVQTDSGGTEQLSGLIETNAALQPGDSGGPLLNSAGSVVGMDTAASAGSPLADFRSSDGYAIAIGKATAIAKQIVAGTSSATVHVGGTAFLGVQVQSAPGGGVLIVGTVPGGPAATAGLVAGDLITAVDGSAVEGPSALQSAILAHKPGASLTVTYSDMSGATHIATVTLGSGPAQ